MKMKLDNWYTNYIKIMNHLTISFILNCRCQVKIDKLRMKVTIICKRLRSIIVLVKLDGKVMMCILQFTIWHCPLFNFHCCAQSVATESPLGRSDT